MAKFKQVPQSFMFRKLVKYCRNMVKNFDSDCRDNDFFDVVRNCFDHDKAVELIEAAYSPKELEDIMESNRHEMNEHLPAYSRLSAIRLHNEEFAKTPKKSIKRYLYQA
jgi:hypothetical protein